MTDSSGLSEEEREALRGAVARQVMGWESERVPWAYSGTTLVWCDSEGLAVLTVYAWQPDVQDAQAMQVVERMVGSGFRFTMGAGDGYAFAQFECGARASRAEDPDRRIAILKAALGALCGG